MCTGGKEGVAGSKIHSLCCQTVNESITRHLDHRVGQSRVLVVRSPWGWLEEGELLSTPLERTDLRYELPVASEKSDRISRNVGQRTTGMKGEQETRVNYKVDEQWKRKMDRKDVVVCGAAGKTD